MEIYVSDRVQDTKSDRQVSEMSIKGLKGTIGGLIFMTFFSQFLSFVREIIFAYCYGTEFEADAYVMASQIPVTLFAVVTTAINTVILPVYIDKKENKGGDCAEVFLKSFMAVFGILCIGLTLIAEVFAERIVRLFAPYFVGEIFDLTVVYTRVLFPTIILTALTNLITIVYHAEKNFIYPVTAALLQNGSVIVCMAVFSREYSTGAAVAGTVAGIALNMIFMLAPRVRILLEPVRLSDLRQDIWRVLYQVIPVTIGVGAAEINRIVDRAIASGLDTGSITSLNYSNKLTVVLSSLILSALATVAFQTFSSCYVKGQFRERSCVLARYITVLLVLLIPVTVGALLLKREIIAVVFARGAFDETALNQTAAVFQYAAIGIVFIAVREILSKYFFSSGDTKTPMVNTGIGVFVNIVLNVVLSRFLGAGGLALAASISSITVCSLLMIKIVLREDKAVYKKMAVDLIKILAAAAGMSVCLLFFGSRMTIHSNLLKLIVYTVMGACVYFAVLWLTGRDILRYTAETFFHEVKK